MTTENNLTIVIKLLVLSRDLPYQGIRTEKVSSYVLECLYFWMPEFTEKNGTILFYPSVAAPLTSVLPMEIVYGFV